MKTRSLLILQSILLSAFLTACGGGGGGGSNSAAAPASAGTAEGMWVGMTSAGYGLATLVLENAETWGFYYSGTTTTGVLYGTSTGSGSSFNATGTDFNFYDRSSGSGSLTGTVVPSKTITATASTGGSVSLAYDSTYNTPASLAAVAGNYVGWGVTKSTPSQSGIFTINSAGAISSTGVNCSLSGSVTPRSSGKNVYNVSTTFTGSACALGNGTTTTGVATLVSLEGINRLIMMTLNSAKTDGYIINGYTAGTPTVAATVPAQSAVINWEKAANSQIFATYTSNGCVGSLASAKTNGTSQTALFEGAYRPYSTTTTTISYSNCTPAKTTGVTQSFTDSNYIPFGYSISSGSPANNAYYGLYSSTPNFPVSLTAGASGTIGTVNRYTSSTKSVSAGKAVVTYTSTAETSTTLLLNLVETVYDASNILTYTEIDTYRITTSGVATLLGGKVTYANGQVLYFY
jgi:hypothetical protein